MYPLMPEHSDSSETLRTFYSRTTQAQYLHSKSIYDFVQSHYIDNKFIDNLSCNDKQVKPQNAISI